MENRETMNATTAGSFEGMDWVFMPCYLKFAIKAGNANKRATRFKRKRDGGPAPYGVSRLINGCKASCVVPLDKFNSPSKSI